MSDWPLADKHQHSSEPSYRLSAACWRCDDADPISDLGLCGACLSLTRGCVEATGSAPPHIDPRDRLVDSLSGFAEAISGPDLYRCSFVHEGDALPYEAVTIGTARFTIDPPARLEPGSTYVLDIDRETGVARLGLQT
jgi:hypothetical protein